MPSVTSGGENCLRCTERFSVRLKRRVGDLSGGLPRSPEAEMDFAGQEAAFFEFGRGTSGGTFIL